MWYLNKELLYSLGQAEQYGIKKFLIVIVNVMEGFCGLVVQNVSSIFII